MPDENEPAWLNMPEEYTYVLSVYDDYESEGHGSPLRQSPMSRAEYAGLSIALAKMRGEVPPEKPATAEQSAHDDGVRLLVDRITSQIKEMRKPELALVAAVIDILPFDQNHNYPAEELILGLLATHAGMFRKDGELIRLTPDEVRSQVDSFYSGFEKLQGLVTRFGQKYPDLCDEMLNPEA